MRAAGWVLIVLGAVATCPALGMLLVGTIDGWGSDPYGVLPIVCFGVAALGACIAGMGGLMIWVGRPRQG